ncbi:hypothetical protein ASF56_19275 [Methylobacterium sp. Leaf122]|nr:hypothetical protein ASF33_21775 [Methylobacterium sp. Leaf92]KQQ21280.1 hypothetical protein ASF56_19275 [Methylobacterium sp. Leaf122]
MSSPPRNAWQSRTGRVRCPSTQPGTPERRAVRLFPSTTARLRRAAAARIGPFRHLPALFHLAWATSRTLMLASIGLRLARAAIPALILYVAKLVVDTVVAGQAGAAAPASVPDWLADHRNLPWDPGSRPGAGSGSPRPQRWFLGCPSRPSGGMWEW